MQLHIDPSKLVIHDKLVRRQQLHNNGQLFSEDYYLNGKYHNPNGPAYRAWYENGQLSREEYCLNGKHHNPNGPAILSWHSNGQPAYTVCWLNGVRYSKEEYDKLAK